jgi:hypothetical protein
VIENNFDVVDKTFDSLQNQTNSNNLKKGGSVVGNLNISGELAANTVNVTGSLTGSGVDKLKTDIQNAFPKKDMALTGQLSANTVNVSGSLTGSGVDKLKTDIQNAFPKKDMALTGSLSLDGDIVFSGNNKWIVHTPDDGRKVLYIAPHNNGNWDWAKEVVINNNGDVQLGGNLSIPANKIMYAPGRMHITGEEILYLLNKNGVQVSKAWGGNGNITAEGEIKTSNKLCINSTCVDENKLKQIISKTA